MNKVHFSSNKDEWGTPPAIFNPLDAEFDFDLDPCATKENRKCQIHMGIEQDGLSVEWFDAFDSAFVNPPYSKLKDWIKKCSEESKKGMTCVMLIPSRTDTKAWHKYIYDASRWRFREGVEVRFIPGRIKFVGGKHCAPFPSCIVIFRPSTNTSPESFPTS